MTIFIHKKKVTSKVATEFISEPDGLVKQIVRAWHESTVDNCFKNRESFKKGVWQNRATLESPRTVKMLFTRRNYLFSTKAEGREETLYFKDRTTRQTGRLRQQHRLGPLAKIDRETKKHRFVSNKRYKLLKASRKHSCGRLPRFYACERRAVVGKRHIEFTCEGKSVARWHRSKGTTKTSKRDLEYRIGSALENILGIRRKEIRK
jgi:hypothetical protein